MKPEAVSAGDLYSMIHALRQDGYALRLEGESESIEAGNILWKMHLHREWTIYRTILCVDSHSHRAGDPT